MQLITISWNSDRTWVSDANGNRNSVDYWGSDEEAEKALLNNANCTNCSECSNCYACYGKAAAGMERQK